MSIVPIIHDCPHSHIDSTTAQLHGYETYFTMHDESMGVCVCASPLVMRGDTVKHALTSTSSPPNDVPSIPWSPVVLPLWTPWGAC
jgi:hypothetical protein